MATHLRIIIRLRPSLNDQTLAHIQSDLSYNSLKSPLSVIPQSERADQQNSSPLFLFYLCFSDLSAPYSDSPVNLYHVPRLA